MRFLPTLLVTLAAVTGPALAQSSLYAASTTPLKTADGQALGTVYIATPVKVLSTQGGLSQVAIDGWATTKSPSNVYIGVGVRNRLVKLADVPNTPRKVNKEMVDDYRQTWQNVTLTGWVDSKALVQDQKVAFGMANQLYMNNCAKCHSAHPTTAHTPNEWIGVLKAMGPRTPLTKAELEQIQKYLQFNAKKP